MRVLPFVLSAWLDFLRRRLDHRSPLNPQGRGRGVGLGLGIGLVLGVGVGRGVEVAVGVGVGDGAAQCVSVYVCDTFNSGKLGGQIQKF